MAGITLPESSRNREGVVQSVEEKRWREAKQLIGQILCLALGTILMAVAVNCVFEPMEMVTGGVSGVAIILQKLTGGWRYGAIPVWLSNLLINLPIFLVAFRIKGKRYLLMTLFANLFFTAALFLVPSIDISQGDYVLAAAVGGVLNGAGLGLVFQKGFSTGGTDLLSSIIHYKVSYYSVSRILFILDSLIIVAGAVSFGVRSAIYAVIAVFFTTRIMDTVLEGGKFAKMIYIVSERYEQIGQDVMERLDRGVTVLPGIGMFTGQRRNVLLCVAGKKELPALTEIVRKRDAKAFVIISDAREVFGEGFVENRQ